MIEEMKSPGVGSLKNETQPSAPRIAPMGTSTSTLRMFA
jgi:hypothetical protein